MQGRVCRAGLQGAAPIRHWCATLTSSGKTISKLASMRSASPLTPAAGRAARPSPSAAASATAPGDGDGEGGPEWPNGGSREQVTQFINERYARASTMQLPPVEKSAGFPLLRPQRAEPQCQMGPSAPATHCLGASHLAPRMQEIACDLSRREDIRFMNPTGMVAEIEAKLLPVGPERVLSPHVDWVRSRILDARRAWDATRVRATGC